MFITKIWHHYTCYSVYLYYFACDARMSLLVNDISFFMRCCELFVFALMHATHCLWSHFNDCELIAILVLVRLSVILCSCTKTYFMILESNLMSVDHSDWTCFRSWLAFYDSLCIYFEYQVLVLVHDLAHALQSPLFFNKPTKVCNFRSVVTLCMSAVESRKRIADLRNALLS